MRKQALLNLFMLALVAALAAVVLWGPDPDQPAAATPLTDLQPQTVQRIEIAFPDMPPVVLVREDTRWRVDNRQRWPADGGRIERILALAAAPSHARYALNRLDAAEVGLAPPRVRVRLDETVLEFGAQEPLNRYRYIRLGEQVHLVTDTVIHQLSDRPEDFVSRRLLPDAAPIVGLQLPDRTLTRDENGAWRSVPPERGRSQDNFNRFIDAWRYATALRVESIAGAAGGESGVVVKTPAAELHFALHSDAQNLIVERADLGLRYIFDSSVGNRLLRLPDRDEPQQ